MKIRDETAYPDRDPFAVSPLHGTSNRLRTVPSFQFIIRSPAVSRVSNIVFIIKANKMHYFSTFGKLF